MKQKKDLKKYVVATHDGLFHSDEVFAVAILKLVYPNIRVIRTRDEELLKKADFRVDVGRKYSLKTKDFDHHQKEFKLKRNKIPYASCGLIWKHYGRLLTSSKEAFENLDKKLFQEIDSTDYGIVKEVYTYGIYDIIVTFYPDWKTDSDYTKEFNDALEFAVRLLKKEIEFMNDVKFQKECIKKAISKIPKNQKYLVLEKAPPIWKGFLLNYPNILYVIYKSKNGNWHSEGTRIRKDEFKTKKPFPEKWADLTGNDLSKITGVADAFFCHKARFLVVAKSKEGAMQLTKLSLEQ